MIKDLENKINNSISNYICIDEFEKLSINVNDYVNNDSQSLKSLININKSNVIIDGLGKEVHIDLYNTAKRGLSFFYISPSVKNVEFRNIKIILNILNNFHSNRIFNFIDNNSVNFKMINCQVKINCSTQLNLICLHNDGNLVTHMETRADNMIVDNCIFEIECIAENYLLDCSIYGIYNDLANSVTITNNHIYTTTLGNGDAQRAVGIYTNGRYGRYIGNNIKANGSHPAGLELEQASAYGFVNEGLFTIINANNIVAQWAGIAIGIENKGEEALITSNKVLSTHNIFGRCIRNYEGRILIDSNMLVSTSKNARMVEHNASNAIISNNFMEVLLPTHECITGCGIYSDAPGIGCNTFIGNIMFNMKTCGLFVKPNSAIIANNQLASSDYATLEVLSYNQEIKDLLDESHIKTIVRE